MTIENRAKGALWEKFRSIQSNSIDEKGYVDNVEYNLISGVTLDMVKKWFEDGAGQELADRKKDEKAKMKAVHSSSALAVNSFGRFMGDASKLEIMGYKDFETLQFEAKCPTGLGGTPPHLDVLLESKDVVIAIESKFIEPLSKKTPKFSPSYCRDKLPQCEVAWWNLLEEVKTWKSGHFDAAQIVKHYLGIRKRIVGKPGFANGKKVILLYLYWKPLNADKFKGYDGHAKDIEKFREGLPVNGSIEFFAMSYLDLWEKWAGSGNSVLVSYAKELQLRYCVEI